MTSYTRILARMISPIEIGWAHPSVTMRSVSLHGLLSGASRREHTDGAVTYDGVKSQLSFANVTTGT
jgi:hypothetical protein